MRIRHAIHTLQFVALAAIFTVLVGSIGLGSTNNLNKPTQVAYADIAPASSQVQPRNTGLVQYAPQALAGVTILAGLLAVGFLLPKSRHAVLLFMHDIAVVAKR